VEKIYANSFKEPDISFVHGGKGSHIKLKKNGFPTIIIPDHKELKKGTEHALMKILAIDKPERQ